MKKLFYYCYGGAHTSVTCASIHLKYLPSDYVPTAMEFKGVPFYDKMENNKIGTPIYAGRDEFGWDVYFMGMRGGSLVVIPAIKSYLNENHICQDNVIFVNTLAKLHPITSIGGFSSRKLGLVPLGRPMTIWGIRQSYPSLTRLVCRVKESLKQRVEIS
jgi:hypothetical protein